RSAPTPEATPSPAPPSESTRAPDTGPALPTGESAPPGATPSPSEPSPSTPSSEPSAEPSDPPVRQAPTNAPGTVVPTPSAHGPAEQGGPAVTDGTAATTG
ncbi:hypothetical protein E6R61_35175, partial [Streptomyces sp. LRa12]